MVIIMQIKNLPCNLVRRLLDFLSNELKEEQKYVANNKPIFARTKETIEVDDLYYTLLEPDAELLKFDDGTWVKITKGGFLTYGSLWQTEDGMPYLISTNPIPDGTIEVVESDGLQLLIMQQEAYKTLLSQSSMPAKRIFDIIFRGNVADIPGKLTHQPKFYDNRVASNTSQKEAVEKSLTAVENQSFFLVHGPPGTGKTTVITEIVKQLVEKGKKVLITSHTNVAVNNVMENLASDPSFRTRMVRLGPRAKVSKTLKDLVPTHQEELVKLSLAQIVGATLSKLSILVLNGRLSFKMPFFDTVIVDESSMATIPLTLAGILHGTSFILVGDHKQLPPITRTDFPETCPNNWECGKICESLFRFLIELYPERSRILDLQFRSHPEIMGFSQRYIYNGKIRSSEECSKKRIIIRPLACEQIPGTINDKPTCYINMCYGEYPIEWFPKDAYFMARRKTPSCFNMLEAVVAIKVRHDLIKAGIPPEKVWIITPFRIQREIVRKAIKMIYGTDPADTVISIYENLIASTVDAIQGKENDVVIYSLTWVPSGTRIIDLHPALKDERRLNVALTRARKKLIIIGDLSWISVAKTRSQNYYELLESYLKAHNAEVLAPDINENDDFLKIVKYCFQKKKREDIPYDLQVEVKKAIQRIRNDLGIVPQPKRWIVRNEKEFQEFKEELWSMLKFQTKQKIYELRQRNVPFMIEYTYNHESKKYEGFIKVLSSELGIQKIPLEFEI